MTQALDLIRPSSPLPLRADTNENRREDHALLMAGVLDGASYESGYRALHNPVDVRFTKLIAETTEVDAALLASDPALFTDPIVDAFGVVRDRAFGFARRELTAVRRQHNLRTTQGRDQWQRLGWAGDVASGSLNGLVGNATAISATSLTDSGAAFPTAVSAAGNTGLQGKIIVASANASGSGSKVYGVIVSNTATVITVDQWYAFPIDGTVGTTPNATAGYIILPWTGPANWLGLSTDTAAAAAGDVFRTADGLYGTGTGGSAASEQNANGLAPAYVNPTFPLAGRISYSKTFTYSTSGALVIAKVILSNAKPAAGRLLVLETLLASTGTINSNGDTITPTWLVDL